MMTGFAAVARAGALCLWLASLALPAQAAPVAEGLPDLDPMDPATCNHEKGYVIVYIGWLKGLDEARKNGTMDDERFSKLGAWMLAMDTYLLQTDDVLGTCLKIIEVRKAHRF